MKPTDSEIIRIAVEKALRFRYASPHVNPEVDGPRIMDIDRNVVIFDFAGRVWKLAFLLIDGKAVFAGPPIEVRVSDEAKYRGENEGLVPAPYQRDPYTQQLSGQPLADYLEIASRLSEGERAHAIRCGMSAPEMLRARTILPTDSYRAAVDGTTALSARDELVTLAARGKLAAADLPSLPKDVREGAALVTAVTRPLDAIAQAANEGRFDAGPVATLAFAAQRLAKARGEPPSSVTPLVDAVRSALAQKNAGAVRDALEQVAEFFDLEINAPPPVVANRAICRGVDVGLTSRIV